MKNEGKYEAVDKFGHTHCFNDIQSYNKFILDNMHLFLDYPLLEPADTPMPDMVEQPPHYTNRKYEVIDVMHDTMTPEQFKGYLIGCVIKYIMRWDKKDNPKQDLQKARWYLQTLHDTIEEEQQHVMDSY